MRLIILTRPPECAPGFQSRDRSASSASASRERWRSRRLISRACYRQRDRTALPHEALGSVKILQVFRQLLHRFRGNTGVEAKRRLELFIEQ